MQRSTIIDAILGLPRPVKRAIALSFDGFVCALSVYVAFYLRLGDWVPIASGPANPMLASVALALPLFVSFGLYRAIFRYSGWPALATIARAVIVYAIPFATIYTAIGIAGVPRTVGLIQPILLFLMIGSSRALAQALLGDSYRALWETMNAPRVLIYGAGSAGRQLASAIGATHEMRLIGFIDDDPALWRATMNGVAIHAPQDLAKLIERKQITDILLAIPSASRARRREIVQELKPLSVRVRTLPGVLDIARGSLSVSDLKELEIEDILGRAPVPPDEQLLRQNVEGKIVLVTGAGGSIGSELCRQIYARHPALLLLVDASEFNLYAIHHELSRLAVPSADATTLIPLLGSVCDARRIDEIIAKWEPDAIYHAAAYKHVPLVEHNPLEGVNNNVFGTLTVASAARAHGVANFVLISTDKAVRPTNVMGTTKRLAEMILQGLAADPGNCATCFSIVRFGNVLGSSGSVVPLFRSQIARGGPVTVTHEEMTRYFMTIPEAAQLVLQSGSMAMGGDVFVLDMGEPVKIMDLARNMIELSGLSVRDDANPLGDIEIHTVGLRPGEKLYEELLIGGDTTPSSHPLIMRSAEPFMPMRALEPYLNQLRAAVGQGDVSAVRSLLRTIVPEYQPTVAMMDHVATHPARVAM